MPWLLRDGEVLATLEVAESFASRARGLLGRDGMDGALLLRPARSVHTIGMRFPIDVAFCDPTGTVIRVATLKPRRVSRLVWRAGFVVEAPAGAFERWRLSPGDLVEIKD